MKLKEKVEIGGKISFQSTGEREWENIKKNNSDSYCKTTVLYAERWATLMEAKVAEGKALSLEVEKECASKATEGLVKTSIQHSLAKKFLKRVWIHGDLL